MLTTGRRSCDRCGMSFLVRGALGVVLVVAGLCAAAPVQAQRVFTGTFQEQRFGDFRGVGFAPSPAVAELDSDEWSVIRNPTGTVPFGATCRSGACARGGATMGGERGIYSFDTGLGEQLLGVAGAATETIAIVWKLRNSTGAPITGLHWGFAGYERNVDDRTRRFGGAVLPTCSVDFSASSSSTSNRTPGWVGFTNLLHDESTTIAAGADFCLAVQFEVPSSPAGMSAPQEDIGISHIWVTSITCGDETLSEGEACDPTAVPRDLSGATSCCREWCLPDARVEGFACGDDELFCNGPGPGRCEAGRCVPRTVVSPCVALDVCSPVTCDEDTRDCELLPGEPLCCLGDADCEDGFVCDANTCVPESSLPDAGRDAGLDAASPAPDAASSASDDAAVANDADLRVDTGVRIDGGSQAADVGATGIDAAGPAAFQGSGCACRVGSPGRARTRSWMTVLGLVLLASVIRRARERARSPRRSGPA